MTLADHHIRRIEAVLERNPRVAVADAVGAWETLVAALGCGLTRREASVALNAALSEKEANRAKQVPQQENRS